MSNQKHEPTLRDVINMLEKSQGTLEEIAGWLRVDGAIKVKKLLEAILDSPEKILIYHLSDGKSNKDIGDMCEVDPKTVSNYCRSWHVLGLMKAESFQEGKYKYFKIFNVEDFGIRVPKISKKIEEKEKAQSAKEHESIEQVETEVKQDVS